MIEFKPAKAPMEIGTKISLVNSYSGSSIPYTVVGYEGGRVVAREAKLVFYGERYYDSYPDEIKEDPFGEEVKLTWSPKRSKWIYSSHSGDRYPKQVVPGWRFEPNLD